MLKICIFFKCNGTSYITIARLFLDRFKKILWIYTFYNFISVLKKYSRHYIYIIVIVELCALLLADNENKRYNLMF